MTKIYILLFSIFFLGNTLNAQNKKEGKEKIRTLKIAYLTEKLDLTSKEAEKFWPLYNDFGKTRKELFRFEKKELRKKIKEGYINSISNKEAKEVLNKVSDNRKKYFNTKTAFHKTLAEFLSFKKILLLEVSEREFNKKLMNKLKNKTTCN